MRLVIKSINGSDLPFYNKNGRRFFITSIEIAMTPYRVIVTIRHQKNRQNGERITLVRMAIHPKMCPVVKLALMELGKYQLDHPNDMPLAVYVNQNKQVKYLAPDKVTKVTSKAIRTVHPDKPANKVMRYSTHSIRVWTCVKSDEAGKSADFIKKRFRWLGESYCVYLRNTVKLNQQHVDAL